MKILHRYIIRTILTVTLVVLLVISGLIFFISLLGEVRDIGTGDYGFFQAVMHVLLGMPYILYQFFPMLVLLSGIIGLGILSANHELVVMRCSGMSLRSILSSLAGAAVILILCSTLIGEGIAPQANFLSNKRKDSAQNSGQAVATAAGVWIHEGNNFLHVDRVVGYHHLEGVTRYQFDSSHHLLAAYFAKSLDFQNGHWQLHGLLRTVFASNQTMSQFQPEAVWDLALNPNLLNVGLVLPGEMSLRNLKIYSNHLEENRLQAGAFQFEFWKRIFQPFATLLMVLLAVPFVLTGKRDTSIGLRVLFGTLVGFSFYILNALLGQFSLVFQVPPVMAAMLPAVLFAAVGYPLIRRI